MTLNRIDVRAPVLRTAFRRLSVPLARHVMAPLDAIERLPRRRAARVIDVARSALAARCREVHAMNQANPDEVYLADLGEGVQLAVIGVLPAQRLLLEANYGYVLLSNGVPIGYGGVSPLFRQANTGINVFDPFRGSEATYLWAQTLRAFRSLFGVRRFIVNGYQFGAGNAEAIASGAYWFYYRLGFRPTSTEHQRLAEAEAARLQADGGRSPAATLRQLARGDLVLDLPDWDDARRLRRGLAGPSRNGGGAAAGRPAALVAPGRRAGAGRRGRAGVRRATASTRRCPNDRRSNGSRRSSRRCRAGPPGRARNASRSAPCCCRRGRRRKRRMRAAPSRSRGSSANSRRCWRRLPSAPKGTP